MSQFLSLLGWAFLPNFVSGWVQTIYYGMTIRAGEPKPAPGSPRFLSHRRTIQILVVAVYLLYTIYEADHELRRAGSFYADLGVPLSASDRDVKARFRRLAALHHPDKAGAADAAAYFMHLKLASDTLQDAARRFAYDRFGPDAVSWQRCVTVRDFVSRGVVSGILPHYAVAAATIYVLGLLGYLEFGKFWRWLVMLSLCVFELHAVTRPAFPAVVDGVNAVLAWVVARPPYLPFQIISLARKVTITLYIAFAQLGPLLALGGKAAHDEDEELAMRRALERLEAITEQLDSDTARLMDMELAPFKGDPEAAVSLGAKMREWLVQNTIRADPMVRDAVGTSLRRRRIEVPASAKDDD